MVNSNLLLFFFVLLLNTCFKLDFNKMEEYIVYICGRVYLLIKKWRGLLE